MNSLAPVILFAYNRPSHTIEVIEKLKECKLSEQSELIIFCDGPKKNISEAELNKVLEVRRIVNKVEWNNKVKIFESKKNLGLANSIIHGVSKVLEDYNQAIILEDDVLSGKYLLEFMNKALNEFKNNPEVSMISGYNFPVDEIERKNSSYFAPFCTTQAWAVWKDKWNFLKKYPEGYEELKKNSSLRYSFNHANSIDNASMLLHEMESERVSSWAIRLAWNIFKSNSLVLFPDKSLIKNIGWDGSGRHCGDQNPYEEEQWKDNYLINTFPNEIKVDNYNFNAMKKYIKNIHNPNIMYRIKNKIYRMIKI